MPPALTLTLARRARARLPLSRVHTRSGALPYLRDDLLSRYDSNPDRLAWVQELVVSSAIVAAAAGSALGGLLGDRLGRKAALWCGDAAFLAGALLMAAARGAAGLVAGRALVGLGIGIAAVNAPVYLAECAPSSLRATLVTVNVLMITSGQFASYLLDYIFTYVPGTWRWMLVSTQVTAVVHCFVVRRKACGLWLFRVHRPAAAPTSSRNLLSMPFKYSSVCTDAI